MPKFRRSGDHDRGLPSAFRVLGVLIAMIVCAALVARSPTSAHPTDQRTMVAQPSFAVMLPVVVRLEAGQLFHPPAPVVDTTATPTATPTAAATATATNTPTIMPSATPTNTPECDRQVGQNLKGRLLAPNTGQVINSSASCTYPVGLASYLVFDNHLSHQQLFASQIGLIGPGQALTFTVDLPSCAYQLDLFYGPLLETFDPQHGQVYGKRILITRVTSSAAFCVPGTTTPTAIATPSATPAGLPTATATASPTATDSPTPTQGQGGN